MVMNITESVRKTRSLVALIANDNDNLYQTLARAFAQYSFNTRTADRRNSPRTKMGHSPVGARAAYTYTVERSMLPSLTIVGTFTV